MLCLRHLGALICGGVVGVLGGLIGLGGAEFRLPILVGVFRYRILQAIILNLIVSLATVLFSFLFRAKQVPVEQVAAHWPIILNMLAGSLLGSYAGVLLATRAKERGLRGLAVVLLVSLNFVLMAHDRLWGSQGLPLWGCSRWGLPS